MIQSTGTEDEFLTTARQTVSTSGAEDALETLGWWDLLGDLDDPDTRMAVFAFFRAQGGALGDSGALGGLLAQSFIAGTDLPPGSAIAAIRRESPRHGAVDVVVGTPSVPHLLIDRPGQGVAIVDTAAVELVPVAIAGQIPIHEVRLGSSTAETVLPETVAAEARARSVFLGRVAIAMEILGACERAVETATDYAAQREQFGQPIGTFQAVRHLLAWAQTDCTAVEAVTYRAVRLDLTSPPRYDEVVKALAGRNGRRVCQRTLQVLGGIGFTAEHDHHHIHSRVLALDALLGSSTRLTTDLGRNIRTTGDHPGFPAAMLTPAAMG